MEDEKSECFEIMEYFVKLCNQKMKFLLICNQHFHIGEVTFERDNFSIIQDVILVQSSIK